MLRVERKFKTYKSRKLYIYDDKKVIDIIVPWCGWYAHDKPLNNELEEHMDEIRKLTMENLYWLLGKDTDKEGWDELINYWDHGQHVFGVAVDKLPDSMFISKEEKQLALNSFENK